MEAVARRRRMVMDKGYRVRLQYVSQQSYEEQDTLVHKLTKAEERQDVVVKAELNTENIVLSTVKTEPMDVTLDIDVARPKKKCLRRGKHTLVPERRRRLREMEEAAVQAALGLL